MNFPQKARLMALLALLVTAMLVAGIAQAQEPTWCVSPDPAVEVGCAAITLSPAGTTADFYNGDLPLAAGVNPAQLLLSPGTTTVAIRNIQSIEEGFGTLFTYADTTASVTTTAGQIRASTVTLRKTYIRGTLAFTCDVRGVQVGEDVSCLVAIDTVPQPLPVLAGQKASYVLDSGPHTVTVTLAGTSAWLWSPAAKDTPATITAGRTTTVTPRFDKRGHLFLNLSVQGVTGDFYVDGELVAAGVASAESYVAPGVSHKVEVRNVVDPAQADIYRWKDASSTTTVSSNTERTVTLRLQQEYFKGYIKITCTIASPGPEQGAHCMPFINGVAYPVIPAGTSVDIPLAPDKYAVTVEIGPFGQFLPRWVEQQVTVTAGRTSTVTARLTAEDPYVLLNLVNRSGKPICVLIVESVYEPNDFNQLRESIVANNSTFTLTDIPFGFYNLGALSCDQQWVWAEIVVELLDDYTWTVTPNNIFTGPFYEAPLYDGLRGYMDTISK